MGEPHSWKLVSDRHYVVDLEGRAMTLHAFWQYHVPDAMTEYFLAVSDARKGLPYDQRPVSFVSYEVLDGNPHDGIGEIRADPNTLALILSYAEASIPLSGLPEEVRPFFEKFADALQLMHTSHATH